METVGILKDVYRTLKGKMVIAFECDVVPPQSIQEMGSHTLDVTAKRHRQKRSLNANALLWKCIGDIAHALPADKWEIYLQMLRRYGEYTYVCVKPSAVEMLKKQWRECEEFGEITINGEKAVQMLCYYGSSTYNTKQFSRLLDGVIGEMAQMDLETPTDEQLRRSIEQWEKDHEKA